MNKEKQIEEMAKDYYGYSIDLEEDCKFVAEEMYDKGHRKLTEDSVVLSREEFDKLGLVVETVQEYESDEKGQPILVKERKTVKKLRTDFTELLNQEIRELQLAQERKETAEKIVSETKKLIESEWTINKATYENLCSKLNELAQQFGVEIKE